MMTLLELSQRGYLTHICAIRHICTNMLVFAKRYIYLVVLYIQIHRATYIYFTLGIPMLSYRDNYTLTKVIHTSRFSIYSSDY